MALPFLFWAIGGDSGDVLIVSRVQSLESRDLMRGRVDSWMCWEDRCRRLTDPENEFKMSVGSYRLLDEVSGAVAGNYVKRHTAFSVRLRASEADLVARRI